MMRLADALLSGLLRVFLGRTGFEGLTAALNYGSGTWRDYCAWKFRMFRSQRQWRVRSQAMSLESCAARDESNYATLDQALATGRALVLAIPHYGCYVDSIIGLALHIAGRRRLVVFYEDPARHATNVRFDELAERLFSNDGRLEVAHNSRAGLRLAMRALAQGGVVVLMPDVYGADVATYPVPFAGRTRQVALGAAHLTRHAGGSVLPVVSSPLRRDCFRTEFGLPIETGQLGMVCSCKGLDVASDYLVTREIFRSLQELMRDRYLYWQYASSHFLGRGTLYRFDPTCVEEQIERCLVDPRLRDRVFDNA
jgi:hypothetical protein